MAALIEGELIENQTWGLILRDSSGTERVVMWPSGYSGRRNGRVELVDEDGVVVAQVGDRVRLEGGEDITHAWIVCSDRRPIVIAKDGPQESLGGSRSESVARERPGIDEARRIAGLRWGRAVG